METQSDPIDGIVISVGCPSTKWHSRYQFTVSPYYNVWPFFVYSL